MKSQNFPFTTPNEAGFTAGLVFNPDTKCEESKDMLSCESGRDCNAVEAPRKRKIQPATAAQQQADNNGGIDVDQFAQFLEILTNPKVKLILKPEVAVALDSFLGTQRPAANRRRPHGRPPARGAA